MVGMQIWYKMHFHAPEFPIAESFRGYNLPGVTLSTESSS